MKKFRSLPRIVRAFLCIVVFIFLPMVVFLLVFEDLLTNDLFDRIIRPLLVIVLCLISFQVYVSTDEELFEKHSLLRYRIIDRLIIVGAELTAYLLGIWIVVQDYEPNWLKYLLFVPAVFVLYIVSSVLIYSFGSETLKQEKLAGSFLFRRMAGRIAHDPLIKAPIFLRDNYGVHVYRSVQAAERHFKPQLATGDEVLYDREGRSLRIEVHDDRIVFKANEAYYPNHGEELRQALSNFLAHRGVAEDKLAGASLQELVDVTLQYGI